MLVGGLGGAAAAGGFHQARQSKRTECTGKARKVQVPKWTDMLRRELFNLYGVTGAPVSVSAPEAGLCRIQPHVAEGPGPKVPQLFAYHFPFVAATERHRSL